MFKACVYCLFFNLLHSKKASFKKKNLSPSLPEGTTQSRRSRSSRTRRRTCDWGSRVSCRARYSLVLWLESWLLVLKVAANIADREKECSVWPECAWVWCSQVSMGESRAAVHSVVASHVPYESPPGYQRLGARSLLSWLSGMYLIFKPNTSNYQTGYEGRNCK